jgi:PKD repeat protein
VLHPNLSDALTNGFHLLAGRAPFVVQFRLENAHRYRVAWDFDGNGSVEAQAGATARVRFDQPGEHTASVTLADEAGTRLTLTQKIVVLDGNPPQSPPGKFGVNQDLVWDRPAQLNRELELMRAAGVEWVRLPMRWWVVENRDRQLTWDKMDNVVAAAHEHELEILAVLDEAPQWSNPAAWREWETKGEVHASYPPELIGDFARYVYNVVRHYRGRVRAYELLNEPNSANHWRPKPDAELFVQYLCAGYYAAKYADPDSVVVVGGLNGNGLALDWQPPEARDFLKTIYSGPGRECFDVMAIHPFAHPTEDGLPGLQSWVDETRMYMLAQSDRRELWITETGWSSGPNLWGHATISEAQQAAWVETIYRDLVGPQKIFWYNFKEGRRRATDPESQWGWLRSDLEPKPAYESFKALRSGD